MNLLLDTHTLLWFAEGAEDRLSIRAKLELEKTENNLFVSIATFWEIGIKLSTGKLDLKKGFESIVVFANTLNISILPISIDHIKAVKELSLLHRDPFDRMLIAQASVESFALVTADKNIPQYSIKTIW